MSLSTEKAYEILSLPLGSSKDAIEQSYKKLAVKWHPDKYASTNRTHEAFKKFKSVNIAFRKLMHNGRDDIDISLHEMFEQYRQVFHGDNKKNLKLNSLNNNDTNNNNSTAQNNNSNKNQNKTELNGGNRVKHSQNHAFGNELNLNLINKSNTGVSTYKTRLVNDRNNNNEENYENSAENTLLAKSRAKPLALKGNELAKQGEFTKAIEKYTEAIKMDPSDHRLYVNRSYCYDKLNHFLEALIDAEKAISIDPTWPKGYFRKGRALFGLKMYKDAEEAYEKVLDNENIEDPELEEELYKIRVLQLQEMGFSKSQSENAIKNYGTVQNSLESILMYPDNDKSNESCSDLENNELDFNENDSDNSDRYNNKESFKLITNFKIKSNHSTTSTSSSNYSSHESTSANVNSNNSHKNSSELQHVSTSLWIGNVDSSVTESELVDLFTPFGSLANVRCLPEKFCAFVNFKLKEDAAKAMHALQGKILEGQRLLIKYPDNPNTAALVIGSKSQTIKVEPKKVVIVEKPVVVKKKEPIDQSKVSGPVNGNECYFWRTTGCLYGDKCHYEHIKKNKGIDKKPWHK